MHLNSILPQSFICQKMAVTRYQRTGYMCINDHCLACQCFRYRFPMLIPSSPVVLPVQIWNFWMILNNVVCGLAGPERTSFQIDNNYLRNLDLYLTYSEWIIDKSKSSFCCCKTKSSNKSWTHTVLMEKCKINSQITTSWCW